MFQHSLCSIYANGVEDGPLCKNTDELLVLFVSIPFTVDYILD